MPNLTQLSKFSDNYDVKFFDCTVNDNQLLFKQKLLEFILAFVPCVRIWLDSNKPRYKKILKTRAAERKDYLRQPKTRISRQPWAKLCIERSHFFKDKFYNCDLPSILKNNRKTFWKLILPYQSSRSILLMNNDGSVISDAECHTVLNSCFSSTFTDGDISTLPFVPDVDFRYMDPISITSSEIAILMITSKFPAWLVSTRLIQKF